MTLIYFILILGLTVFIHELGHFIFAKKNGVYCYEFSLGMGPKLFSFRRKNDETEYSLRLLPIGGYVQMAGEEIEEDKDLPKDRQMQSKTVWQRFTIEDKNGKEKNVSVKPTKVKNEDGTESYIYGLGFSTKTNKGFISSIKYSFSKFGSIYRSMLKVIGNLFTGNLGINSLSGPVGIYNVVGEQSKQGFQNVIYLAAYISINVGFVNLIPFPAFDGGRALFLIIEKIRKKPIEQKTENIIHTIGFMLLMLLIIVITINDIIRIF